MSNRFRLSKLHRNRCRCPRFPPRRHKPTPVDTGACPGWSPTFSVSSQTYTRSCTTRPVRPSLFQLPDPLSSPSPFFFSRAKLYEMYIDLIVSLPLIHLSLNLGSSHDDIFQSSSSIINLYSVQASPCSKNSLYRKLGGGRKSSERSLSRARCSFSAAVLTLLSNNSFSSRRRESRFVTLEGRSTTSRLLKAHPQPDGSASIPRRGKRRR